MLRNLLLLTLPLLITACSGTEFSADDQSGITITVAGAAPGKVVLVSQYVEQQYQADTATADASGTVRFQPEEPYEPGYYFAFYNDQSIVPLLLDEDQSFAVVTTAEDVIGDARVEGSLDNQLLYEGLKMEEVLGPALATLVTHLQRTDATDDEEAAEAGAQRDKLIAQRRDFYEKQFAEHPKTFYTAYMRADLDPAIEDLRTASGQPDKAAQVRTYRRQFWDGIDFSDVRLLHTPVLHDKVNTYFDELTVQRSDSVIAAIDELLGRVEAYPAYQRALAQALTLHFRPGQSELMDPEAVFVHMVRTYYTRERADYMDSMQVYSLQNQAAMMEKSLLGEPGPRISVPGLNGQPQAVYAERDPYLIVYIYNPECDHCIEETPKLLEWSQERPDAGVYALALGTTDEKWRAFVKEFGLQSWTNVHDPSDQAIYRTYYVDSTPEMYVLGPDRTIIGKNLTTEELNDILPPR
ncbi:DUF5106 domain-containing protein [Lewinella sp. IMCC34183]|uniref:DUF5106 domain-containing protein n=1 Tax=Lewinella sp. IMCC34183 TaxID=2248762 RepID=UPI000E2248E2|nr:thioredoxin-like domain-containing protein [Lewinella sp. IMCC34183]